MDIPIVTEDHLFSGHDHTILQLFPLIIANAFLKRDCMNTEEKRAIPKRISLLLQNDLERKRTLDNAHATERKGTEDQIDWPGLPRKGLRVKK